jgi:hypothetical protein
MKLLCNVRDCSNGSPISVPENQELGLEDDYLCSACLVDLIALMERRTAYLRRVLSETET